MSIYEILGMNKSMKGGISPYNPNILTDEGFGSSFVTDRHMPDNNTPQEMRNHGFGIEQNLRNFRWTIIGEPSKIASHVQTAGNKHFNENQPGPPNFANLPNHVLIQAMSKTVSPNADPLLKAPPRSCTTTRQRIRISTIKDSWRKRKMK